MTPRERVAATLNHEKPDRMPIDLASNCCSGVNVIAYNRLKKSMGITTVSYVRNIVMMISAPRNSIMKPTLPSSEIPTFSR